MHSLYVPIVVLKSWTCRNGSNSLSAMVVDAVIIWGKMLIFQHDVEKILVCHGFKSGGEYGSIWVQNWVFHHDSQSTSITEVGGFRNPGLTKLNSPSQSKTQIHIWTQKKRLLRVTSTTTFIYEQNNFHT